MSKNFIKKQSISNAEFKGQIVEVIAGAVIAIIGAILYFMPDMQDIALLPLALGGYLFISGLAGILPYGIAQLTEKGKYIAFSEEEVVIYSPNPKKCVNIPMKNIKSVKFEKERSFDIFGTMLGKKAGNGNVFITYINTKGEEDIEIFGAIDNCKQFISDLEKYVK